MPFFTHRTLYGGLVIPLMAIIIRAETLALVSQAGSRCVK